MIENSRNLRNYVNFLFLVFCLLLYASSLEAKVTGVCSNCHTMHNSQGGSAVAYDFDGTSFTKTNVPKANLLVSDCIGCHTAINGSTWKDPFTGAPIVLNTSVPTYGASSDGTTHQGLAGGNFYWVAAGGGHDDAKGHNVLGISGQDAKLTAGGGCGVCCHKSLAIDPSTEGWYGPIQNGCKGCHVLTKHHVDEGVYRFLYSHSIMSLVGDPTKAVRGVPDPNWEHSPTSSTHNTYIGANNPTDDKWQLIDQGGNISAFCGGCHHYFHYMNDWSPQYGIGASEPWFRHPSDLVIPGSGEYTAYTNYDPILPVGRPEDNYPDPPSTVRPGTDRVICVSCHRAHGSPYFKMMRWDYNDLSGNAQSVGCSTCHSSKD
jgi:hypothetical protein